MKLKTHSATKKRVKITGSGKKMYKKSATRHLLKNKSKRQKSAFAFGKPASSAERKHLSRLLPNS